MTGKINRNPPPKWLGPWLKTPFYDDSYKCKKHVAKYTTVFCGVCMEKPYCRDCWNKGQAKKHEDHLPILHVRIASSQAAAELGLVKTLLDISDIQVYKINSKDIVHLHPTPSFKPAADRDPHCRTCRKKLGDRNYCFCSIACKFTDLNVEARVDDIVMEENNVLSVSEITPPPPSHLMMEENNVLSEITPPTPDLVMEKKNILLSEKKWAQFSLRRRRRKGFPRRAPW